MKKFEVWMYFKNPYPGKNCDGISYSLGDCRLPDSWLKNLLNRKTDFLSLVIKLIQTKNPSEDIIKCLAEHLKNSNYQCDLDLYDNYSNESLTNITYKIRGTLLNHTVINKKFIVTMLPSLIKSEITFDREAIL